MDKSDLLISALNWEVMLNASERMDDDLANAKKKQGICMKYKSMIPARAWEHPEPFDVGHPDEPATPWMIASIVIGMDMRDRLQSFANQHGINING